MSWWGSKSRTIEPEPVPVVDRQADAQRRVVELKAQLDTLDSEMLAFKQLHKVRTNRFGILLGIECASLNGRAAIEREWRALLRRRDALVSAWHKALFAWSELKESVK